MKSLFIKTFSFPLLCILLVGFFTFSCRNAEDEQAGAFSFTKTNGKTYTTSYVDIPIPVKNGTFSLQYLNKGGGGSKWMFFVLVDNNNDLGLDIEIPTAIVNGTVYSSSSNLGREVSFYGMLDNVSLDVYRTTVVFEKSIYPGQVAGTFSAYGANNSLLGTGKFDFVAQ